MNPPPALSLTLLLVAAAGAFAPPALRAQSPPIPPGVTWRYQLLEGSTLTDDCYCGRPTLTLPLRGSFALRLIEETPLSTRYAVESVSFHGGWSGGKNYDVTGTGTFELGGEVALRQSMFLVLEVTDDTGSTACLLTNTTPSPPRPWPMLVTEVEQTNKTDLLFYRLNLVAAPLQEIWFSVANGLTSGVWMPPTNAVSAGDLLSASGRRVRANSLLTAHLGVMPLVPDLGLDAVDLLRGGDVAFSIEWDVFSETLGPLRRGDVLSASGRILARANDLAAGFGPEPPPPDAGLDALRILEHGEIHFSFETNLFSETLGVVLQRGDLLSSTGRLLRSNQDLLARFHPADPKLDYGLDAFYLWTSGEIWFSLEEGFSDLQLGSIMPGDLLSDQGAIVYRNLELTAAFAPLEDLADFGLDALFVVTDALPPRPAPRLVSVLADSATGEVRVECEGEGQAFQLERTADVRGPWSPAGPIVPDRTLADLSPPPASASRFYRVRQW